MVRIFSQNLELAQTAAQALPIFSLSFLPMALNLIDTAFLFSTKRTMQANLIAASRGIVAKAIVIFSVPVLWGEGAVWLAPFLAEGMTLIFAAVLTKTARLGSP